MAYVTKQEVKNYLGVTWTSGLDTFIDKLIAAATRYVEEFTDRVFEAPSPDSTVTRFYNGNGETKIFIDDLRELTSLTVDGVELTVDDDFLLYPLNAEEDGEPYRWIELIQPETRLLNANPRMQQNAPYIFDVGQKTVEVEGKWGYSVTPPEDVQVAVMKLVGGIIKENIGDTDLREVTQETLGEYSTTYGSIKNTAHALGIDALLSNYLKPTRKKIAKIVQVN